MFICIPGYARRLLLKRIRINCHNSESHSVNPIFSNHKFFQKIFSINSAIYREFKNRPNAPPPRLKTTKRRPLRTVAAPDRQTSPSGWCRANLDGTTPCSGYLPAACSPVCAWPVDEVRNARPGALRFWRIGVRSPGVAFEQFQATASLHRTPPGGPLDMTARAGHHTRASA